MFCNIVERIVWVADEVRQGQLHRVFIAFESFTFKYMVMFFFFGYGLQLCLNLYLIFQVWNF